MSDCRISKIDLNLHIEASDKLSKLVLAPLVHILFLEQRLSDLDLHICYNALCDIVVKVHCFVFLNKIQQKVLRLLNVGFVQLSKFFQ